MLGVILKLITQLVVILCNTQQNMHLLIKGNAVKIIHNQILQYRMCDKMLHVEHLVTHPVLYNN